MDPHGPEERGPPPPAPLRPEVRHGGRKGKTPEVFGGLQGPSFPGRGRLLRDLAWRVVKAVKEEVRP